MTLPARPNQACCLVGHDAPLARVCRGKSPAAGSSPRRSGPRCRNYAEPAVAGYFKKNNLPARLMATSAEDRLNPPIDVIDVCRLVERDQPFTALVDGILGRATDMLLRRQQTDPQ